jgi:uncharacterized membrane protein
MVSVTFTKLTVPWLTFHTSYMNLNLKGLGISINVSRRIEWLIMAAVIIFIVMIVVIWFFNFQTTLRDSKRKADIKTIANALEIHYNTSDNQYCKNGLTSTFCHPQFTWFEGGVPHDPLYGDYINLPKDGDKSYTICAKLELGRGNSSDLNGTSASGMSAGYYCQKNQQ